VNLLAGLVLSSGELTALGAGLGADVGFFAQPAGLALGQGRGERLRALPPLPERTLVLGCPPAHVATGPAYGALARSRDAAGGALPPRILAGEPPANWEAVAGVALNDFTPVVADTDPAIAGALAALASEGAEMPLLSGSGAAVFGVVPGGVDPEELLRRLAARDPGTRWVQATTLDHLPSPERLESPRGID
jgi:4-diphosphocytidyl-2-C-methyl-D-erythritol kinase